MISLLRKSVDRPWQSCWWWCLLLLPLSLQSAMAQQQVLIQSPYQQIGDSFYENFGLGWGFSNDNFFINVPNGVRPPFGLGDPNADARLGFGFRGFGGSGRFNLTMGQGSNRTNSTITPMLMLPNGGTGSLFHGSIRPFVTSFIPVVGQGGYGGIGSVGAPLVNSPYGPYLAYGANAGGGRQATPPPVSPVHQKIAQLAAEGKLGSLGKVPATGRAQTVASPPRKHIPSSAERGDVSVAEIRRQQALKDALVEAPYEAAARKAAAYESEGKLFSARQQYKNAARQAPEEQQTQLYGDLERVSRLIDDKKSRNGVGSRQ